MKKYLISLLSLLLCTTAWAGNKVTIDLTCLNGQTMINFDLDWSQLKVKSMSIDDWVAFRQAEQPEYDALEELEKQCKPQVKELTQKVNKKLEKIPLALAKKEGCKYTLRIVPLNIDNKGNNELQCTIVENESQKIIADFVVKGEGGHWGSMSNLWGDGFEHAGETLGNLIYKAIKKPTTYSWK